MTFTHDEWKSFYTSMRSYVANVKNRLTDKDAFDANLLSIGACLRLIVVCGVVSRDNYVGAMSAFTKKATMAKS